MVLLTLNCSVLDRSYVEEPSEEIVYQGQESTAIPSDDDSYADTGNQAQISWNHRYLLRLLGPPNAALVAPTTRSDLRYEFAAFFVTDPPPGNPYRPPVVLVHG